MTTTQAGAVRPTRGTPVARSIGVVGLVGAALLFAALITGSPREPELDASTTDIAAFVRGLDPAWLQQLEVSADLAMMVLLWFLVGLALLLRRFEGDLPLRSTMAIVSAAFFAALVVLDPSLEAAVHRASEMDDKELAFAYDLNSAGFANVWVAMATFSFACGWLMLSSPSAPRWLGWWGVVGGVLLAPAQFVWTVEPAWLAVYIPWWFWLLTTCVLLVRRPGAFQPTSDDLVMSSRAT